MQELLRVLEIKKRQKRAGVNMGMLDNYTNQIQQQQQGMMQNMFGNIGGLQGQLGQVGAGQYLNNPQVNTIPFPGLRGLFGGLKNGAQEMAEKFGFEYDFDTGGFKHKNGGFVSRRQLEDSSSLTELFTRAKTPNIHWLDDRIDEVRVRLI